MSWTFEIFRKYYEDLVRCLPMDDVTFIAKLFTNKLLPNDLKGKLKSLSTTKDKAAKLLDDVIEPGIQVEYDSSETADTPFITLLAVMKDSGDDSVEKLADRIMAELNHKSSSSRESSSSVLSDLVQRVAIHWFKNQMKEGYIDMGLTQRDEENDPWPPVQITSFTTPLFMHHKQLQTEALTKAVTAKRTVGKIQDISESKKLAKIEEIFEPINSKCPKRILIEGHPGIGKTTVVKEICVRWAKGKLLKSDELLLLLFLRDPKARRIASERQLVEYFMMSVKASPEEVELIHCYLEDERGKGVTLIIDGYDELEGVELDQESFFIRLIKMRVLKKARVVITSCPSVSICLHQIVDKRIEILGFDKSGKEHFIGEMLKNSPDQRKELLQYLQLNPKLEAVCYVPLIMTIMVFLCMHGLPDTVTKLCTKFILHIICRYLKRKGMMKADDKVTTMEEFPNPVSSVIKMLEEVAYNGLLEGRRCFEVNKDLPYYEIYKIDLTCFGLLQSTRCYNAEDVGAPILIFSFNHIHLQKYFAAKHMISLEENEAYDLIRKHLFIKHTRDCRNTNGKEESNDEIIITNENISSHEDIKNYDENYDDGIVSKANKTSKTDSDGNDDDSDEDTDSDQSNEESQDTCIMIDDENKEFTISIDDLLKHFLDDNNYLEDEYSDDISICLLDMWLFLFGLTNGLFNPLLRYLSTYSSSSDDDDDERVQDDMAPPPKKLCVMDNVQTFSSVDLSKQSSSVSTQQKINKILSQDILDSHAKLLYLFQCFQETEDDKLCDELLQIIYEPKHINLENQVLNSHHITSLGFLLSNYKWKKVSLAECSIGKRGINQLYQYFCAVGANKLKVKEIDLSCNSLLDVESTLAYVISCLRPHTLNLSNNFLLSLESIASIMTKVSQVKQLYVENSFIFKDQDKNMILSMLSLSVLYIGGNGLEDKGTELLAEGLPNTESLQILNICDSKITCKGAKSLALALSQNKSLQVLDLHSNGIGDHGAMAIAETLTHSNTTLRDLALHKNNIGYSGTNVLKNMVKTKTTTFKLVISRGNQPCT